MVFRTKRFGWIQFDLHISIVIGKKVYRTFSPNAEGIAVDQILVRFCIPPGDMRCRSLKLSGIAPNFACFGP